MTELQLDGHTFEGFSIPTSNTTILIIKARHGILGCGYLSLATAEKVGDALALVSGVKSFDDMLNARIGAFSAAAAARGVISGMSGREALLKLV